MPLYSSLSNRETKPGLSTGSKPLMIPRLLRSDQIQGRGPPGKQSPCRWAAGPLSKHKRSRSLCPRACPRGRGCGAATALRFSREPPARDRFQRGKSGTQGPRPHGNPRARTRARRAPGRRPPAPRLGPRTPTPRRLTGPQPFAMYHRGTAGAGMLESHDCFDLRPPSRWPPELKSLLIQGLCWDWSLCRSGKSTSGKGDRGQRAALQMAGG